MCVCAHARARSGGADYKIPVQEAVVGQAWGVSCRGPCEHPLLNGGSWQLRMRVMAGRELGGGEMGKTPGSLSARLCRLSDLSPSNGA